MLDDIKKIMSTPRELDLSDLGNCASLLTLHLIGYIVRPTGLDDEVYQKCREAFAQHRGQYEWEEKAVFEVLEVELGKGK